ncbi:MAG: hypothetical protein FJ224_06115 [Lentisphaerae bacterium]|nr:hypothetical protein [Lentisphaerota bacterium]
MRLLLVDGIGPFFRGYSRRRINWSKIPFENLERDGRFDKARFASVSDDFSRFVDAAAATGFNGVTLDDLAHLSECPDYDAALSDKLARYRDAYRALFEIAAGRGLTAYVTTDVVFEPAARRGRLTALRSHAENLLPDACSKLFCDFPSVGGVIFRIGECDARDVRGGFSSRLAIRTPAQARKLIQSLLPVFESAGKLLIFRTWTVGAHPIGDLIWNRNTFDAVFGGFDSTNLVLSMKYGETDFFRYLPLNQLFFRSNHRKIVELQARREYEGFGEFPSFVGWDYEDFARQLAVAPNMAGAWIWCQTGGWSGFRRRTFLEPGGAWNEINTFVSLRIVRDGISADDAVRSWARERLGPNSGERLLVLLRMSDETIKEALYIDEFARRKLFFRRLRIPPLLSVFWDQIIVNHSMRKLLRCFVRDPEGKLAQSEAALVKIRSMRSMAAELGLPAEDFDFQYDTFEILMAAREYYFGEFGPHIVARLHALKAAYDRKYPVRYTILMDFSRFRMSRAQLRLAFALLFRSQRGYRWVDRLLLIRLLSLLSPLLALGRRKAGAARLADQAMGFRTVLK